MFILDTNVLSELLKLEPEPSVLAWLESQPRSQVFTTAITEAEIAYGVALLPKSLHRQKLQDAAQAIFDEEFADKVLPFDSRAARTYGDIAVSRRAAGRPISQLDAMIAGIVQAHQGRLVTRNVKDFVDCEINVVNPWDG
jgi:hypothetical protein